MDPETVNRPCVGCGFCCKKAPCALGWTQVKDRSASYHPCEHLVQQGKQYRCGLYLQAETSTGKRRLEEALALGAGCCCPLNSARAEMVKAGKT